MTGAIKLIYEETSIIYMVELLSVLGILLVSNWTDLHEDGL